jgi:hypothetical protein
MSSFAPKSFCQKITNPICKQIKAAQKTFVQKSRSKILVKLTPGYNFSSVHVKPFFVTQSVTILTSEKWNHN